MRTQLHQKIVTKDIQDRPNGYLVPIYNLHEGVFADGRGPEQVYLTVIAPGAIKGPHLHYVRRGFFTCIKGNVRIVIRTPSGYEEYYSGELHGYRSVEVPTGIPAALQNVGPDEAFVLNMPSPAWTPDMHDEHTADFSDYDFQKPVHVSEAAP